MQLLLGLYWCHYYGHLSPLTHFGLESSQFRDLAWESKSILALNIANREQHFKIPSTVLYKNSYSKGWAWTEKQTTPPPASARRWWTPSSGTSRRSGRTRRRRRRGSPKRTLFIVGDAIWLQHTVNTYVRKIITSCQNQSYLKYVFIYIIFMILSIIYLLLL